MRILSAGVYSVKFQKTDYTAVRKVIIR